MTSGAPGGGYPLHLATAGQATYIGYVEKFREINIVLTTAGSSWSATLQYPTAVDSNGNPTSWAPLLLDTDTTAGFSQSGQITFDPPANWVTATVNGSPRYYYVRVQSTAASGTAPVLQSILGRDYVNANGGTSGTIPVFDYAADTNHDGYLNDSEYAVAEAAGDYARFVYESRVFCNGCGPMRFSANVSNPDYRKWAVSFSQALLAQYPLAAGISMDNSSGMPNFTTSQVLESTSTYSADYASLLGAIDQAISPLWIMPNVINPYQSSANLVVQATSAYSLESLMKPMADNINTFQSMANAISALQKQTSPPPYGIIDSSPAGGSPTDPRMQLATLAEYYMVANPTYTFLDFYGGYNPEADWSQRWSPAAAYNIGQPTDTWSVFATGTDPSNPQATYNVYQRHYTNALVLYKPLSFQGVGIPTTTADNTATTHALNGIYEPLNADGTLGAPESSVTLRNGEGAILIVTTLAAANGSLTTAQNTAVNGTLSGTGSGALKFAVVTQPAHGIAIISNAGTGAFTYTPTTGYSGSDSFTFNVTDSTSTSNTATETLTVTPTAPTASNGSITTSTGKAANGALSASGGDTLTYAIVTQPAHGTVTVTSATGAFTYTPTAGYTGADSFTFTASNTGGTSNTATESITVTAASSGGSGSGSGSGTGSGTNSNSSGSSGKSGGGALGWPSLAALILLAIRRRKCHFIVAPSAPEELI